MLNKKMRLAITFVLLVLLLVTCIFIIAKYIDWLWIIGVVTISFGTLTALIIFVSNRPARTKISWIIAVYALPIVGIIIFIIFGRTYRYTKAQKFYLKKYQDFYAKEDFNYTNNFLKNQIKEERSILHLTTNISQRPLYNHTKVDLITNGIEKFSLLFKDLESAENYIHINYFILDDGEVLKYLTQLLIKKTYQGVNIRLIYDHAGSFFTVYHDTIQKLKRAGVHLKRFSPINLPFISGRNNYRNHRKDVIIDGKIGYTGGINVGDAYCHLSSKYGFWRDSQVRLQGSAVCSLELIFLQDWYFTTGESLVFDKKLLKNEPYDGKTSNIVQVIDDGPNTYETIQKDIYVKVISSAKSRVWLSTPYFIPTDDIVTALKNAAKSGVDVRLLMPGKTDKFFILDISRSYYDELFNSGIKIYEMSKIFNHSKTALIDDNLVIIGSTNLDFRSLYHDHQTIVILYGDANKQLEKNYLWDIERSILLTTSPLKKKNWFYRIMILPIVKIFDPLF
ncbi:cardiolipin synthase [Spiroplasma endosymbiont of Clivina fossor]|uniref:cardiolipin synthase n=1 Tax=Spiroplasma endosymbiont of Clivina fossor TaxID=3066282 RepID=UPI00313BAA48